MVLVASASDHRHRRAAKSSPLANPATPSTLKVPAAKAPASAGLQGFSFTWGAQRRLRCSKDGAPVNESPSPSPPQHPHTPSPDKDNPKPPPPPQDTPAAGVGSTRPQRPRNLRPLRQAASRPDGAGHQAALKSPKPAKAQPRKRGFAVALTKEEIARDFAAIRRCPTRPAPAARRTSKKRPKAVQIAIDKMCPGFLLLDVDLDNYKIEERGQQR
uniref:Uncharacterized protein n=1 Tax=Avena sativa TaxID=4498 RepID=A0ACD5T7P6_AVESA